MRVSFLVFLLLVSWVTSNRRWKKTTPKETQRSLFRSDSSTRASGREAPTGSLLGRSPLRGNRFKLPDFDSKKYTNVIDTRPPLTNPNWVPPATPSVRKTTVNRKDADLKNVVLWLWKRLEGREFVPTDPDVQYFLSWCTNHFKLEKPYPYKSGRTTFVDIVEKLDAGTFKTGGASTSYNWPTFLDVMELYMRSKIELVSSIDGKYEHYMSDAEVIRKIKSSYEIDIPPTTMSDNLKHERIKQFAIEARLLVSSNEQVMVEEFRNFFTLSDGLEQLDDFVARTVEFNRGDGVNADDVMFEMEMAGLVSSMIGFGRHPYTIGPKRDLLAQSNMIKETVLAASREMASKIFDLPNEHFVLSLDGIQITVEDFRSLFPSNNPTLNIVNAYFSILSKSSKYSSTFFVPLDGFRSIAPRGFFTHAFAKSSSVKTKKRFVVPVEREPSQYSFYVVDVTFSETNQPIDYKLKHLYSNNAVDEQIIAKDSSKLIIAIDWLLAVGEEEVEFKSSVKNVKVADYGLNDGKLSPETTNLIAMVYSSLLILEPGVEIRDGKDVVEFDLRAGPLLRRQMMGVVASSDPSNADRLFGLVEVDPDTETPLFVAGKIAADHLPMISEKWVGEETPLTKRRETVALTSVFHDDDVQEAPFDGPPNEISLPEIKQEAPPGTHYLPTKRLDYGHEFFKKSRKFERSPNDIQQAWNDAKERGFIEKFKVVVSEPLLTYAKEGFKLLLGRVSNGGTPDGLLALYDKQQLDENTFNAYVPQSIDKMYVDVLKSYKKAFDKDQFCYAASLEFSRMLYYMSFNDQIYIYGPLLLTLIDRDGSRFLDNKRLDGEGFRDRIKKGWVETMKGIENDFWFDSTGRRDAYAFLGVVQRGNEDLELRVRTMGQKYYEFLGELLPRRFEPLVVNDPSLVPSTIAEPIFPVWRRQPILQFHNGKSNLPDNLPVQNLIARIVIDSLTRMMDTKVGKEMVIMKSNGAPHRFNLVERYSRVLIIMAHIFLHQHEYTYTRDYYYQHSGLYSDYNTRGNVLIDDLNLVSDITGRTGRQLKLIPATRAEIFGSVHIEFRDVENTENKKAFDHVSFSEKLDPFIGPMFRPVFSQTNPPNPIIIMESKTFLNKNGPKFVAEFESAQLYTSSGYPDSEFRIWVNTLQRQFPEAKFIVIGDFNVGGISIGMAWKSGTDFAFNEERVSRTGPIAGISKMKFIAPNKELMGQRWNLDTFLKGYSEAKLKQMRTALDSYAFKNDEVADMAQLLLEEQKVGGRREVQAEQLNDEEFQKIIQEIRGFLNE